MEQKDWGVHITHCCVLHGCKYGDEDCPVVTQETVQKYECEDCSNSMIPAFFNLGVKKINAPLLEILLQKEGIESTLILDEDVNVETNQLVQAYAEKLQENQWQEAIEEILQYMRKNSYETKRKRETLVNLMISTQAKNEIKGPIFIVSRIQKLGNKKIISLYQSSY